MARKGNGSSWDFKDLNVVHLERSTSTTTSSSNSAKFDDDHRHPKHTYFDPSRARCLADLISRDCDHVNDGPVKKVERETHMSPLSPFSKSAPSKWDDAQKWISSPNQNMSKSAQSQLQTGTAKVSEVCRNWQHITKQATEFSLKKSVSFEEVDGKRHDFHEGKIDYGNRKMTRLNTNVLPNSESCGGHMLMVAGSVGEPAVNLSQHGSSFPVHNGTTLFPPPATGRSVSMRDMGTEMTPIPSQEPSRTTTPAVGSTPVPSTVSSRSSTPRRTRRDVSISGPSSGRIEPGRPELTGVDRETKTWREIMALGLQLGKANVSAWATRAEENGRSGSEEAEECARNAIEASATAWEDAEKAKYMARYKKEEVKIQTWENVKRAKTEAEMVKIEVEVERLRARAHEELVTKLADVMQKAEGKRVTAEVRRKCVAEKTERESEHIRRTGRFPTTILCCGWFPW